MSQEPKSWIVAYDIADPRRLRKVHRLMQKFGVPMQYSAFNVVLSDPQIAALLVELEALIDERADDVRAYHLPASCKVWMAGSTALPDGVTLSAGQAADVLLGAATGASSQALPLDAT